MLRKDILQAADLRRVLGSPCGGEQRALHVSSAGRTAPISPLDGLGIELARVDSAFETYARSCSFLVWLNEDEELPAPVKTTNVNSSQLRTPPYHVGPLPPPPPPPPPFPSSSCAKPLRGTRLIAIHRWFERRTPRREGSTLRRRHGLRLPENARARRDGSAEPWTVLGRRGQRCTQWVVGMGASLNAPRAWSVVSKVVLCVVCV